MVMVYFNGQIVQYMMVNGNKEKIMEKENKFGLMKEHIMVNGNKVKCMEQESIPGLIKEHIMEIELITTFKGMEFIAYQMEQFTKVIGKKVKEMARVNMII